MYKDRCLGSVLKSAKPYYYCEDFNIIIRAPVLNTIFVQATVVSH